MLCRRNFQQRCNHLIYHFVLFSLLLRITTSTRENLFLRGVSDDNDVDTTTASWLVESKTLSKAKLLEKTTKTTTTMSSPSSSSISPPWLDMRGASSIELADLLHSSSNPPFDDNDEKRRRMRGGRWSSPQQRQRDYAEQYEDCINELNRVASGNAVGQSEYVTFLEHVSRENLRVDDFMDLPLFLTMIFFSTACTSGQNCVDFPPHISVVKRGIALSMMNYFCRQVYQYPFVQVQIPFEYVARHYSRLSTQQILQGVNGNTIVQGLETATTNLLLHRFNCSVKGQRRLVQEENEPEPEEERQRRQQQQQQQQQQLSSPSSEVAWATKKTMAQTTKKATPTTTATNTTTKKETVATMLSDTTRDDMRQPLREYLAVRKDSVVDKTMLDKFVRRTQRTSATADGTLTFNPFCDFQVATHITNLVEFGSVCTKPENLGGECVLVSSTVTVWAVVNDSFGSKDELKDYITDILRNAINDIDSGSGSGSGSSGGLILEDFIPANSDQLSPVGNANRNRNGHK